MDGTAGFAINQYTTFPYLTDLEPKDWVPPPVRTQDLVPFAGTFSNVYSGYRLPPTPDCRQIAFGAVPSKP